MFVFEVYAIMKRICIESEFQYVHCKQICERVKFRASIIITTIYYQGRTQKKISFFEI